MDKTTDPVEMLAILRRHIASQYLVAVPQKRAAATHLATVLRVHQLFQADGKA